jgi:hypothetical protein
MATRVTGKSIRRVVLGYVKFAYVGTRRHNTNGRHSWVAFMAKNIAWLGVQLEAENQFVVGNGKYFWCVFAIDSPLTNS